MSSTDYSSGEEETRPSPAYSTNSTDKQSNTSRDVYPSWKDLNFRDPHIRVNNYLQPFDGLQDYCETHFLLLKEELVGGIRSGLKAFHAGKPLDYEQIRVLTAFKFESHQKSKSTFSIPLNLAIPERLLKIGVESASICMFGTVLFFSVDNFMTPPFLATVVESYSHQGQFWIRVDPLSKKKWQQEFLT